MARLLISIILMGLMLEQVFSDSIPNSQTGQNLVATTVDPAMTNFLAKVFEAANQMAAAGPKPRSSWTSLIVRSVIPLVTYVKSYGSGGAILFGQTILVLFVGFMMTVGICTLTSVCTINWNTFGITNELSKNNANNLLGFLTSQEALDVLTTAISEAIEQSSDTLDHKNNPHYYPRQAAYDNTNIANQQKYWYQKIG